MKLGQFLKEADSPQSWTYAAFPLVLGVFASISFLSVGALAFVNPYYALLACAFIFMVLLVTANLRYYRQKKKELWLLDEEEKAPPVKMRTKPRINAHYLSGSELHMPPKGKDGSNHTSGDKMKSCLGRDSHLYCRISEIHLSEDPSKHLYANYKESEKQPPKESDKQPPKESEKQPPKESDKQPPKESEKQPPKESDKQSPNEDMYMELLRATETDNSSSVAA